ncbi:uncharacterized protein LOC141612381 isoform X1 [Silene latifolia]|uniref:uncharacterized protein LOC141612381 isoform X1 n=1 Tax=Silene latifolia TaxID=37657 RepID=UPI003D77CE0E
MAATLTPVSPRRSSVSGKYSDESTATSTADSASSSPSSSCYLSECSLDDDEFVDLELGADIGDTAVDTAEVVEGGKVSVDLSNMEKECRICHMSLLENGLAIELGCCCKDDLAVAHQHCANTWFKIRGNKTCEICGSTARNVAGVNEVELMESRSEVNDSVPTASVPLHPAETRHFWQGHKFLNFLLACMVFAFVISWLFHFNVPA